MKKMQKQPKKWLYLGFAVLLICEIIWAYYFYLPIVPFPENEFWFKVVNVGLRDLLLLGSVRFLYSNRKRIPDRLVRYFPVVVAGGGYLLSAAHIIHMIELDLGFLTFIALLTGLINNIFLLLLVSICYHHWQSRTWQITYFLTYLFTVFALLIDSLYFANTSTHVQSVFFDNINIYSLEGVYASLKLGQLLLVAALVLLVFPLFRLPKLTKIKPNFTYSLFAVVAFFLVFNLLNKSISFVSYKLLDQVQGLGLEVELEQTRQEYRDMVSTPVNINLVAKGLFKTDKVLKVGNGTAKRKLSEQDLQQLAGLYIYPDETPRPATTAKYKRVVLLVMESVHRDYFHFYNKKIPAEATPFIDELLANYPRLDNYYSSAIPTTQGLNATFRSQYIYDADAPGKARPTIYRQLNAAGYRNIFLNASSKYYANELREYPEQFGMNEYYSREYLETRGYKGASGWGFHNDVMYQEGLEFLRQAKQDDGKLFLVVKTLDMHQPYPYYGETYENLPPAVRDSKYATVRGMHWVDSCVRNFITTARQEGLLDEQTLVVLTSDHNPHSGGEYKELVDKNNSQSIAPIPLLFISKNLTPLDSLASNMYAGQVDLAPTLLYLLGVTPSANYVGRDLLQRDAYESFALGYFGGKAYYFSEEKSFNIKLDNPYPNNLQEDALANYLMYEYAK